MFKLLKRALTVFMAAALVLAASVTVLPETAEASVYDLYGFNGASCTSNGYAASVIDCNILKYPLGSVYPGTGTCWGYAETIRNSLASKSSTKYYTGLKPTEEKIIELLDGCKAGTHLRVGNQSKFQGNSGHSYSILRFDAKNDTVIWTDNNGNAGSNRVGYYSGNVGYFCMKICGWGYINMVTKVTDYKKPSAPAVKVAALKDGVEICWTKTTGAGKYIVYRATSKSGTYSAISTITSAGKYSYTDKKATAGKTYYYKVKAVKSGSSATSSIVSCKAPLTAPQITVTSDIEKGTIKLSWKAVPGASSYIISRETDEINWDTWTYEVEKVKTTTSTSYTIKGLKPGESQNYIIKAYSSNIKKSSEEVYVTARFSAPEVINAKVTKNADGSETISWDPGEGLDGYPVSYFVSREFGTEMDYETLSWDTATSYDYTPEDSKSFKYGIYAMYNTGNGYIYSDKVFVKR